MTNWKSLIERDQSQRYVLPPGYTSVEDIAEEMNTTPDRVRVLLREASKQGTVKQGVFPVFDKITKSIKRVTAYIEVRPQAEKAAPKKPS